MKCPACGSDNRERATFCGGCSRPLNVDRVCPQCGHPNAQPNSSCDNCGYRLAHPLTVPGIAAVPTSFAAGRFQIRRVLGEGGMKKVYLAHDDRLDRDVALAVIRPDGLTEEGRSRFMREARAMGHVGQHPNIVSVYDLVEEGGHLYMVTELVSGETVEALIEKAPERRLAVELSIGIAKSVCRALMIVHSRGIVHRDLKPANVYVGESGIVKIGDFGLACGIELSRVTRSGMAVGTVSYMTPEQALGLQTTPKTDLYSLGAMLYEMMTGRPPFVGDSVVSIIGQHLNTPPVSPAWQRRDIPKNLEILIMHLLEKNPEKRPESAAAVLQALESIVMPSNEDKPKNEAVSAEYSVSRRVFVGRGPELRALQSAFDKAVLGQGTLVVVAGEPGIGKTALCEQLSNYVAVRGGRSLFGHCYEEGFMSLPYLAFAEAIRNYVLDRGVAELKQELGTDAAEVARIVPEVKQRLKVKLRPRGNPEEDRYRLMQAVSSFLTRAGVNQPLLIVLEDLHDADKGTLEMLTHVSRCLPGTRMLIVGTYRDIEVDRNHPLSTTLANLRRLSNYDRVLLHGLDATQVLRMLRSAAGESVSLGLANAVYRQTEGNPLFALEVGRFLAEGGHLTPTTGRSHPAGDVSGEISIPEGLKDVIGKRLSLLSRECNQLLSVASVIGRDFSVETLRAVSDINEDLFLVALKDAVRTSVLEERSQLGAVRYRFTHAFFRQNLYDDMIAPRRVGLHQKVARLIETQYSDRLEEHAAELAEHFSHSSDPANLSKAVRYGEMAAKKAMDVCAGGEAVRLLERVIAVQKALDPSDKGKCCDLLLALGDALMNEGEPRRILDEEAPKAWSLAEAMRDTVRCSRVCHLAMLALFYHGVGPAWTTPEATMWAERANYAASPNTVASARAATATGIVKCASGHPDEGVPFLRRAVETASHLGEKDAHWWAVAMLMTYATGFKHDEEVLRIAEELAGATRYGVSTGVLIWAFVMLVDTLLRHGRRPRAEAIQREMQELIARNGQARYQGFSVAANAYFATLDGYLEKAVSLIDGLKEHGKELDLSGWTEIQAFNIGLRPRLYLGIVENAFEYFPAMSLEARALCLAHQNRIVEATDMLGQIIDTQHGYRSPETADEASVYDDALLLETAVLAGQVEAAELLVRRLDRHRSRTTGIFHATCIDRHAGSAAVLLGKHDEAREYYRKALEVSSNMRFRPETALIRLQMGELILGHYQKERDKAVSHLDFAISEFREMNMLPSLERALRLRAESLKEPEQWQDRVSR